MCGHAEGPRRGGVRDGCPHEGPGGQQPGGELGEDGQVHVQPGPLDAPDRSGGIDPSCLSRPNSRSTEPR
jgi:hypothetical protein